MTVKKRHLNGNHSRKIMLPWLKRKQISGMVISKQDSEGSVEEQPQNDLHTVAEDLLKAIELKSVERIANALQAAFEICDASEEEE